MSAKTRENTLERAVCDDNCPVRKTTEILEGKWTTLIVRDLLSGTKRFSELQHSFGNVSPKVLSQKLKYLIGKKIVTKRVIPTVPITTEYSLTRTGQKLKAILTEMARFGNTLP